MLEDFRTHSVQQSCWDHLQLNNILNSQQHGFVNRRSTCTNLLESVNDWLLCIQDRLNVAVAYVDFAKAVDVGLVSHKKLFLRLYSYGMRGCILAWLQEIFSDRIQCTKVGSVVSEFAALSSRVIHGSVIGPLLFIIFINELIRILAEYSITVQLIFFADDALK